MTLLRRKNSNCVVQEIVLAEISSSSAALSSRGMKYYGFKFVLD